jgi:hypothetical protein
LCEIRLLFNHSKVRRITGLEAFLSRGEQLFLQFACFRSGIGRTFRGAECCNCVLPLGRDLRNRKIHLHARLKMDLDHSNAVVVTCPRFPHGDFTTQPAAAGAVGKGKTPQAFSKWAEPTSFP